MDISRDTIQNKKFDVVRRGYDQSQVDAFLEEIVLALNKAEKETEADKFELAKYRELEYTLTNTLVTAQKTSQDLVASARSDAESIRAEAQTESAYITGEAERKASEAKAAADAEISAARADAEAQMDTIRNRLFAMRDFEQKYRESIRGVVQNQLNSFNARFASEDEWDSSPVAAQEESYAKSQGMIDLDQVINAPDIDGDDLRSLIDELS